MQIGRPAVLFKLTITTTNMSVNEKDLYNYNYNEKVSKNDNYNYIRKLITTTFSLVSSLASIVHFT